MANYPIAPWLHPQDTVGPYVQGLHLGAQLQQERQRLAQQANEAAVRTQLQQQQLEQETMQAQQRLEVQKAQHQQEAALKQQELAQHQQQIQMATEQAARKYQAMQAYQQEVASGGDPLKAILKYGPAMGQQGSPEAAAIRAQQMAARQGPGGLPDVPVMKLGTSQEEFAMFPRPSGSGFQPVRLGAGAGIAEREMKKLQITMADKELSAREKAHANSMSAMTAALPPEELKKKDASVQADAKAWLEEERQLKAERKALKDQVETLAKGGSSGGGRGKYNAKTGQIEWQTSAPAAGADETDDESQLEPVEE